MSIGRSYSGCSRISCGGLSSLIRSRPSVLEETNEVVLGIAQDLGLKTQALNAADRDKFGLLFQSAHLHYLGAEFNPYIHLSLEEQKGLTVAIVKVDPSPKPVYLKDKDHTEFYIRAGNTTKVLDVEAAHNHISMHWEL